MSIDFNDFDPNNPAHMNAVWMVYTGSWRGIHFTPKRPTALNRVTHAPQAKLYEYVAGQGWVLRVNKSNAHPDICDVCGGPVKSSLPLNHYGYRRGVSWYWKRHQGKIVSPPEMMYVCTPCAPSVEHA